MRFATYHPWTYLKSGIERILVELLRRSRHDWTLYTHRFEPDATFPELRRLPVVELQPRVSVRRSFGPIVRAAMTIATARLPEDGARALLVSSEGLGDLALIRARVPAVCYCHTPLKIMHDRAVRAALGGHDRRKALARDAIGPLFDAVDRRLWRRYRHAFANSAETRSRLVRAGLFPSGPLEVLHPGVDAERFPFGAEPRERFFLVPGRIMWQKNIELAIDAFARVRAESPATSLVVAGTVDRKSVPYLASLRDRARGLPVSFEVDPTDDRLAELYRRCMAVIYPPRNEDFGIVPLESMASGALVLAVDAGGPRETVVDGVTGWLLPAAADVFAARMADVALAGGRLDPMREAARRRALEFQWDRFVARIDDVMECVASGVPQSPESAP